MHTHIWQVKHIFETDRIFLKLELFIKLISTSTENNLNVNKKWSLLWIGQKLMKTYNMYVFIFNIPLKIQSVNTSYYNWVFIMNTNYCFFYKLIIIHRILHNFVNQFNYRLNT